jgi:hypothetical protein
MSKLQKKPAAHKRGHPTLQNMNFFYFCGSFLPSWIRIPNTDPDPDPLARLNTDPIWIRNPGLMDPDPDPGGPKTCGSGGSRSGFGSRSAALRASKPVLQIHDIFVRIRILLFLSLTKKKLKVFLLITF